MEFTNGWKIQISLHRLRCTSGFRQVSALIFHLESFLPAKTWCVLLKLDISTLFSSSFRNENLLKADQVCANFGLQKLFCFSMHIAILIVYRKVLISFRNILVLYQFVQYGVYQFSALWKLTETLSSPCNYNRMFVLQSIYRIFKKITENTRTKCKDSLLHVYYNLRNVFFPFRC